MVVIPEADKLHQILTQLQKDVQKLKSSTAAPQLANSAIDVYEGRGFIPVIENGVERLRIGRQPDGSITTVTKNSTTQPIKPLLPQCQSFIGGVTVTCTGFEGTQYLDFSHVRVYVDSQLTDCIMKVPGSVAIAPLDPGYHNFQLASVNLSNAESPLTDVVVASPNQVVNSDLTDGIVDALKLADEAVTHAKLAVAAVKGVNIQAETIEGSMIAAETIFSKNLASESVTANKIASLAITADKIAANTIEAGNIKAGSVTANKLAAEIVLAGTAIIVGNPTLARLVLDKTGLTQIDDKGNISLQFGRSPTEGNILTVIDPNDPGAALSTLASDGSATFNGMNISGQMYLNGIDLIGYLNSRPQGIVAQGTYVGDTSATTSAEIGMFELNFRCISGRTYLITSDNFYCYGSIAYSNIRVTYDGSVPTVNSPILTSANVTSWEYDWATGPTYYSGGTDLSFASHSHFVRYPRTTAAHSYQLNAATTATVRLLVCIAVPPTNEGQNNGGIDAINPDAVIAPTALATYNGKFTVAVQDLGTTPYLTGGSNDGAGNSSAIGQRVSVFNPTYTKYIGVDAVGATMQDGLQMGRAGNINYVSMIGFNPSEIAALINGSSVKLVELYLYSNYWSVAAGGYACIGTHNVSNIPTSYSYVSRDIVDQAMKKPQGLWITLPNNIATQLASGAIKGLVLDSRINYPGTGNYAIFRDMNYTDATVRPAIRITYTK